MRVYPTHLAMFMVVQLGCFNRWGSKLRPTILSSYHPHPQTTSLDLLRVPPNHLTMSLVVQLVYYIRWRSKLSPSILSYQHYSTQQGISLEMITVSPTSR